MAKKDVIKLETAVEELRQAELAYEKLIHIDNSTMSDEDRQDRELACRNALEAKKAAQKAVEDQKKVKS